MFMKKKVVVVMPAYNAARTLRKTFDEVMSQNIVDKVIIVDDGSRDETANIAGQFPNTVVYSHLSNCGYGANQKTCYKLALDMEARINMVSATRSAMAVTSRPAAQ